MKYLILVSLLLAMLLAGCGGDDDNSETSNDSSATNSTSNTVTNNETSANFAIEFSTDMSLSEAEGKASAGNRVTVAGGEPYAMVRFESNATSMAPRLVQILFANDDLTAGEQPVSRVQVATYLTAEDGQFIPVGCNAEEEGLTVNITATDGNLASGEFTFEVGNCEHYITPELGVDLETVTVSGTFADVPYKPAE